MATINFQQGEAVIIPLSIVENNQPVDLSSAPLIRVRGSYIKNKVKTEFKSYSSDSVSNYGSLSVDSVNNNQINLEVLREDTLGADVNENSQVMLSFDILVRFADASFTNGVREEEYNLRNVATLKWGVMKTEVL
jgi:hypothetical protein